MTDSESDSDCSNCDDSFDLFNEIGGNGFAFEPEYSAEEVKERLRAHDEVVTDDHSRSQCEFSREMKIALAQADDNTHAPWVYCYSYLACSIICFIRLNDGVIINQVNSVLVAR